MREPPPPPPWASSFTSAGVTGTNGKTTTTAFLAAMLRGLGPVVRSTTVGTFLDDDEIDAPPHYDGFLAAMELAREHGSRHAVLELTSEALALGFARSWPCRTGVFTNLSEDHGDVHPSPEHYLASKAQLFVHLPAGGTAVLNAHDRAAALIAEVVPAGVEKVTYGVASRGEAWVTPDLLVTDVRPSFGGTRFAIAPSRRFPRLRSSLATRAIGEIFVENALAALAAALALGVDEDEAADRLADAAPPPGRFEVVADRPRVIVDYAHTPDALARTLATARALCSGRVTVVFGAGGGRDRAKRPRLGSAATAADRVVITSDNPRDEDPRAIIQEIEAGTTPHGDVRTFVDRTRAIEAALRDAGPDDLVVVAGKGHERFQDRGGTQVPLSDAEIVRRCLD